MPRLQLPRSRRRERRETEQLIADLRTDLRTARDKAAKAQREADRWHESCDRLAGDRIKGARLDAREMARLQDMASGWESLAKNRAARLERALRGAHRYRQTNSELTAANTELVKRLAPWEDNDYAVGMPHRVRDDDASQIGELKKTLALRDGTIKHLAEQLATLQAANEAGDWQLPRRRPAGTEPLQAAS